jgi:PleD family two-component response regulator
MEKLKGLKVVLLVLLLVFVLVLVKITSKNGFKQEAREAIEAVESNNFQVTIEDLKGAENQYLIVDLTESVSAQFENSVKIPFEKLLDETTLQKLKETQKKILLVSDDNSVALKAWVILNQLDFRNVFVLSDEENPEVLKYEFQPDTLVRLESASK